MLDLVKSIKYTSPIFIIGCGRSGTTILGESLSKHPDIVYLNEPRDIWYRCYPQTDIWTDLSIKRNGKLVLTANDAKLYGRLKLRALFYKLLVESQKKVLVEKLPINSFRLPFLHKVFPDAKFIYIKRNGLEVAKSIANVGDTWYGVNNYKWEQLVRYACMSDETKDIPPLCDDNYKKGLLEWRLSNEAAIAYFNKIDKNCYLKVTYDEFIDNALSTIDLIIDFIGIKDSQEVKKFILSKVARKSMVMANSILTNSEKTIGGSLLTDNLLISNDLK